MKWKHVWKRALRSVVFVVGSVYGTGLALGILFADRMIFLPRPASYTLNEPFFLLPMHDGNQVCVRHVRNPDARYTILYSHGNAEDIGELGEVLEAFKAHGYAVVAYDYSGYGMSTGAPSEQAAYANIMTVYDYLTEDEKLRPEQIVVFGRSVGGGPGLLEDPGRIHRFPLIRKRVFLRDRVFVIPTTARRLRKSVVRCCFSTSSRCP
jgi:hypothetical protein